MSQPSPPLTLPAYAKINLDLRILGLLPDGYHDVRTVLQSVRLHDTLTFTPVAGPFVIVGNEPSMPTDASNLIWRAAELLAAVAAPRRRVAGVRVDVVKRIPAQAGLGGGSADAAAALLALCRLWDLPLTVTDLATLAARLGADVPFFLAGGTALGTGRGDDVSPLVEPPATAVLVVVPPFGVSTPDAYRWFDLDGPPRRVVARRRSAPPSWPRWATDLRNDLEAPVSRRHPAIGRIVRRLRALGADHAAMSGSGSAVFGLFADDIAAAAAHAAFTRRGVKAWLTATLPRRAVAQAGRRALGR
ncbi:MAG: 4-(cytidine 5'-diphospho)-2-C-methyl-D-erythritol kinase [Vicinamibacterales bacterium]